MRKNITLVICLIAGLLGGTGLGLGIGFVFLPETINNSSFLDEYNDLLDELNNLTQDYNNLLEDYNDLVDDYNDLVSDYNFLFANYIALKKTFEEPLTSYDIPTINEVFTWLNNDDTDTFEYIDDVWICGDFSAMLMTRAKSMNWRMRISCMFWSYEGNSGWQNQNDPYGEYGHAFNFIICQDGNDDDNFLDIYYIEPQTDTIWYVHYGDNNHNLYLIWYTFGGGLSGTVWSENYFINHISYFA